MQNSLYFWVVQEREPSNERFMSKGKSEDRGWVEIGLRDFVSFIEESLIPAIYLCILNQFWVEKMYYYLAVYGMRPY